MNDGKNAMLPYMGQWIDVGPTNPSAVCEHLNCPALAPCPVHMTESTRTSALLQAWRARHPRGKAEKINDATTAGRPDTMFIYEGKVTFVEFKLPKRGETDLSGLSAIQRVTLSEYGRAGANVWVGVFIPKKAIKLYRLVRGEFQLYDEGPEAELIDWVTDTV